MKDQYLGHLIWLDQSKASIMIMSYDQSEVSIVSIDQSEDRFMKYDQSEVGIMYLEMLGLEGKGCCWNLCIMKEAGAPILA